MPDEKMSIILHAIAEKDGEIDHDSIIADDDGGEQWAWNAFLGSHKGDRDYDERFAEAKKNGCHHVQGRFVTLEMIERHESLKEQVELLAHILLTAFPEDGPRDESACEFARRLLMEQKGKILALEGKLKEAGVP